MQQPRNNYVMASLLLHALLLTILLVSVEFSSKTPVIENADKNEVIQAQVIDMPPQPTKTIQKMIPPPPEADAAPLSPVLPLLKPKALPEKPDAIALAKQKKQEELVAKQLLADLKKQTERQKKKAKQKALETAFANEIKQLSVKTVKQQKAREMQRLSAAKAIKMQGIVDKYKAMILQTISQNWLLPGSLDKKRYAELLIRIAPGGAVLDVQLIKSSGDDALDRSARAAVFKSSPLPVPTETDAFESFRQFVLKVRPESALTGESWIS